MTPCTCVCAYILSHCLSEQLHCDFGMDDNRYSLFILYFFFPFFAPSLILRRVQVSDVGQNLIVEVADKVGSIN